MDQALHCEYVLYGPLPEVTGRQILSGQIGGRPGDLQARHPRGWPSWLYVLFRDLGHGRVEVHGVIETARETDE